jgi:putative FmdB family regulatory protein
MPTYQYRCTECGNELEAVQKFTDSALTDCPDCTGQLRKVFNAVGVVFKGSGFYRTDSRADKKTGAGGGGTKTEGGSESTEKKSVDASSSSDKARRRRSRTRPAASSPRRPAPAAGAAARAPAPAAVRPQPPDARSGTCGQPRSNPADVLRFRV